MATSRKQVVTYVDIPTHEWLVRQAKCEQRSVSQFLAMMLKRWADDERAKVSEWGGVMAARIYVVTNKATREVVYVRAKALAGAIRAVAELAYESRAATTDEIYLGLKEGAEVLDAVAVLPDFEAEETVAWIN
jgi:hypothetical protein